ncbi:MAG: ArnT family glycosyltransferase [Planctomycetaceae bacterium]
MMAVTVGAMPVRPLLAIDETRYVSIAWEMHQTGDWLVPHLNGEVYTHKPPLLFWLINLVWCVVGVHELPARLIAPLMGCVCLWQTHRLASKFWPNKSSAAELAPLVLVGMLFWCLLGSLTMFDTLLISGLLLALEGVWDEWTQPTTSSLVRIGLGVGWGVLAKGPAIAVYFVPVLLLSRWWSVAPPFGGCVRCGLRIATAGALGLLPAVAWIVAAVESVGRDYLEEMIYTQATGRTISAMAHVRPVWWYLPLLPVVTIPWLFWGPPWNAWLSAFWSRTADSGTRLCVAWIGGSLLILSAAGGKQIHYLLPLQPAVALLLARWANSEAMIPRRALLMRSISFVLLGAGLCVSPWLPLPEKVVGIVPGWLGLVPLVSATLVLFQRRPTTRRVVSLTATIVVLNLLAFQWGIAATYFQHLRFESFADQVADAQRDGLDVAYVGRSYHGQFNFLGRLPKTITVLLEEQDWQDWLAGHPQGSIIEEVRARRRHELPPVREGVRVLASLASMRGLTWQRFDLWTPDGIAMKDKKESARPSAADKP